MTPISVETMNYIITRLLDAMAIAWFFRLPILVLLVLFYTLNQFFSLR